MKIERKQLEQAFQSSNSPKEIIFLWKEECVKNIQVFGNEVIIDLEITNPSLQYKQKIEKLFLKIINENVSKKADVKINFLINKKNVTQIKGKPIPGVKNIIAISSAKGGVGKSTITANLAVALTDLGYSVGIIDADIYGPSMHIMFDLEKRSPKSININGQTKIKPLQNYGVKLLSIGFFAQSQQAIVWRGPMASKALNQLIWDASWGEVDYLLVDLPPGTGDIHLSLVQSIPLTASIIVSTPQSVALADAKKGINMFQMETINVPVLGLVENMSYFTPDELPENKYYIFGRDGAKNLAAQMNIDLLAEIPLVQSVREAADIGRPAVMQGSTEIAIKFINFAKQVVEKIKNRNKNLPGTQSVNITHNSGCK